MAWLQVPEAAGLGELAARERKSFLWGSQACRIGAPRRAASLPLPPDSCDHQTMGCKPGPPALSANIGLTRFDGQRHPTPPRSPPRGHLWAGGVDCAPVSSSGRDLAARRGGWGPNKVRFQFPKGWRGWGPSPRTSEMDVALGTIPGQTSRGHWRPWEREQSPGGRLPCCLTITGAHGSKPPGPLLPTNPRLGGQVWAGGSFRRFRRESFPCFSSF